MKTVAKSRLTSLGSIARTTRAVITIGSPEFANPLLQYNG